MSFLVELRLIMRRRIDNPDTLYMKKGTCPMSTVHINKQLSKQLSKLSNHRVIIAFTSTSIITAEKMQIRARNKRFVQS